MPNHILVATLTLMALFSKRIHGPEGITSRLQNNKTEQCKKIMFSQRVINPWNALPKTCVNNDSLNKFKSSLNDAWKDHPEKFKLRTTYKFCIYKDVYNEDCSVTVMDHYKGIA